MRRDNQPIHNIGFGVTSRDFAEQRNEDVGPAANSGFIARALEGNPITKMATAMIATGIAATVAGKVVKGQGLKLGYKLTQAARAAEQAGTQNVLTRSHQGLLKVRSILDELEGVTRLAEGTTSLVYKEAGKDTLTTGYEGIKSILDTGYSFARKGVKGAEGWAWRDQLQQSLVRQARRLPYEVPAFYAVDKTVGRKLFGREEPDGPRKKWYDPSRITDIGKDLAKTTAFQLGGFVLPAAMAGASKESSLNFFRTAEQRWDSMYAGYKQLTPVQKKLYENTNFLRGSLSEVGQDIFNVLDKSIKFSERSSGALSVAFSTLSGVNKNPVGDLYAARHGANPSQPVSTKIKNIASDIYRGNKQALNSGLADSTKIDSLLDLIPGYKSIRQGLTQGYKQYKNLSAAQIYLDKSGDTLQAAQKIIAKANKLGPAPADKDVNPILVESIENILRKRTSPLIRLAQDFENQVGVRRGGNRASVTGLDYAARNGYLSRSFKREVFDAQYRKQLVNRLSQIDGVDQTSAEKFADQLYFDEYPWKAVKGKTDPEFIAPENRITIGGSAPETDFFATVIDRYNKGKVGKINPITLKPEELETALSEVDNLYKAAFEPGAKDISLLYGNIDIDSTANVIYEKFKKFATQTALRGTKPKEDSFSVLYNTNLPNTARVKRDALSELQKLTARTIGIDENAPNLTARLSARGFDSHEQMQGYLLNNKAIQASKFGSIGSFFGVSAYTLDEFLADQDKLIANKILRTQTGTTSPLAGNIVDSAGNASPSPYQVFTGNIAFQTPNSSMLSTNPIRQIISDIRLTSGQQGQAQSNLRGFFKIGDQGSSVLLNVNPIQAGLRAVSKFLANDIRVPIININPMQMLGFKDFQSMSEAGMFRVSSASGIHPFVPKADELGLAADMYTWHSTGGLLGTKGKLVAYQSGRMEVGKENTLAKEIAGYYRPLATRSAGMFTRTAELASEQRTPRTSSDEGGFLGKVKQKLDYAEEQPNSLFRFFGRLLDRQSDVNNPAVLGRILRDEFDQEFTIGGFGRKRNLVLRNITDSSGETLEYQLRNAADDSLVASHGELMEAFTRLGNSMLGYGNPRRVSEAILGTGELASFSAASRELKLSRIGDAEGVLSGVGLDDLLSPKTSATANKIIDFFKSDLTAINSSIDIDQNLSNYQAIAKAFSRLKKFGDITDFSAQSRMLESSGSIVTRGDEMGFEVIRYLTLRKGLAPGADPAQLITNITSAIDDLAAKRSY